MIVLLFLPLLVFVVCAVLAALNIGGLSLDKTIKLSDIASLAAITFIAFVIQYIFEKRGKATSTEKDWLTGQITALLASFAELKLMIAKSLEKDLTESEIALLIDGFETWGETLSSLHSTLSGSHCSVLAPVCFGLFTPFVRYKGTITGGNFPYAPITAGSFTKSAQERNKIEQQLRLLSVKVVKL